MKPLAVQRDGTWIDTSQLAFKKHIDLCKMIILFFRKTNQDLNFEEKC